MATKNNDRKIFKVKLKFSWKNLVLYGFLAFIGFFLFVSLVGPVPHGMTVPLSDVLADIKQGKVEEIVVAGDRIIVKPKEGGEKITYKEASTNIYQILKDADISPSQTKITVKDQSIGNAWINVLSAILPIGLMVLFFLFLFRQARGAQESIFSFGSSRARLFTKNTPKTTFTDVAGVDEAKQELTEVVDFLKHPAKYKAIGARTPKGVLLVGPSGTGKTLLARAVAGEANVPFFSIAGSEFMEMLVGVGASRVRDLFNTAKKAQPAIIFIDEIDAIGRQRGFGIMGGHDEREQTLNQILVEMDGFTPSENLIVMAASVTGDTPIIIKKDNQVKLIPIEEFVNEYYQDGEEGVEKEVTGVATLGFEGEYVKNKLFFKKPAFKSARGVFRHTVEEIYEIRYVGGTVRTTGNHSVFVRQNGGIIAKPVSQLDEGETLVDLPYKLSYEDLRGKRGLVLPKTAVETSELFHLQLPVYLTNTQEEAYTAKYIYAMEQGGILSQQNIAQHIGVSQLTVSHWQRQDRLPRSISRAYFKEVLPEEVSLTAELARLMGYYVAEGYARKELDFCFHKNETALIKDVQQLMELIFSLKPQAVRVRGNAVNIIYQSRPLATFFMYHCGKGAHNKHVPTVLFEAPKELFIEFLKGVFEGDGYQDKSGKGEITSVSKQLIRELNWLCRLHGIKTYMHNFTAKEGRKINGGKPLKLTLAYRLGWGKMSNPFKENKKSLAKLSKITSIRKMPFNGYVYDLCGCDNEAFFGGESPILLHNTNRPDILDPALVRPGRFDRRVMLDLPDIEGRKAILQIHAKGKPFAKNVSWEKAAKRTVGYSGADLENMLNEAAILTARAAKKEIGMTELEEAATKVKLGPEKRRLQTDQDRKMTAYHEAGHALVSHAMPNMDPVHRISIVSRGLSLGHTLIPPAADRLHETKTHLVEQVSVMLGGRAAENLVFKEMTTGAADDIAKATEVARMMVVEYGMSELGPINLSPDGDPRFWKESQQISPDMAAKIDGEVKKIVDSCYKKAAAILARLRDKLDIIAKELVKKETLEGEEFERLIGSKVKLALVKV